MPAAICYAVNRLQQHTIAGCVVDLGSYRARVNEQVKMRIARLLRTSDHSGRIGVVDSRPDLDCERVALLKNRNETGVDPVVAVEAHCTL